MRWLPVILVLTSSTFAAADDRTAREGWIDLLAGKPEETWQRFDKGWVVTDFVTLDVKNPKLLSAKPVSGGTVWVNGPTGRVSNLLTKEKFGDCEVHVEFLVAKGSNSGIKFNAVYEIQIFDSFGKEKLTGKDCGGIYPRAKNNPYTYLDEGVGAKVNAAKPAGEWQSFDATFRAAKLNDLGEKTSNAVMVVAKWNDKIIHENLELKHPTGSNWVLKETAAGPFMLQADHGPVAFRNVKIRKLK
jgi:hypothetical protein